MKISCPSCQSKYTIADEKVQGRSVKVRCRKCGATIHVSESGGVTLAPEKKASGAGASGEGEAPTFSVLVAESDQRDMSLEEIVTAYQSGVITAETFVWADGQPDWLPLTQVQVIAEALNLGTSASDGSTSSAQDQGAARFDRGSSQQAAARNANFAQPSPVPIGGGAGMGAARASAQPALGQAALRNDRRGAKADLFGAPASPVPTAGGEEEIATSAPQLGSVVAPVKPTGTREEQSVLFSLNALTAASASPSTQSPALSQDSGLIDLRALASKPETTAKKEAQTFAILDGAPLLATPILSPQEQEKSAEFMAVPKASKTPLYVGLGVAVVSVVIVLVVLLTKSSEPQAPMGTSVSTDTAGIPTETAAPTAPTNDPNAAAPPSTGVPSASAAPKAGGGKFTGGGKRGGGKGGDQAGGGAAAGGGEPAAPKKPASPCGCAPTDLQCNMRCSATGKR